MRDGDVFFRAGVGLLVRNAERLVLAFERNDVSGSWQAPQGGLTEGESPRQAAARELYEETGITWDDVELVDEHPGWLAYELPPAARSPKTGWGQVQKWFLLDARRRDLDIRLNVSGQEAEFATWQWMAFDRLAATVWSVRRPVYDALALHWRHHLA